MLTDPINPDLCRAWILLFSCFIKTLAFHSSSFHGINLNNLFSSAKVSEQGMGRRSSITDKMRGPRHYNWSCFFDKLSSSNWQSSQITNLISCWVLLPSYKSSRKTQLTSTKAWLCFCKVAENWLYVWLILTWLADIRETCPSPQRKAMLHIFWSVRTSCTTFRFCWRYCSLNYTVLNEPVRRQSYWT